MATDFIGPTRQLCAAPAKGVSIRGCMRGANARHRTSPRTGARLHSIWASAALRTDPCTEEIAARRAIDVRSFDWRGKVGELRGRPPEPVGARFLRASRLGHVR